MSQNSCSNLSGYKYNNYVIFLACYFIECLSNPMIDRPPKTPLSNLAGHSLRNGSRNRKGVSEKIGRIILLFGLNESTDTAAVVSNERVDVDVGIYVAQISRVPVIRHLLSVCRGEEGEGAY
jgi:hypothetical protein